MSTNSAPSRAGGDGNKPRHDLADNDWDDPRGSVAKGGHSQLKSGVGATPARRSDPPPRVRQSAGSGSRSDSSEGFGSMVWGAVLLAIGLAVTIGTYSAASSGGGTYVVTYGLIVVGFLRMVTGFFTWIANR